MDLATRLSRDRSLRHRWSESLMNTSSIRYGSSPLDTGITRRAQTVLSVRIFEVFRSAVTLMAHEVYPLDHRPPGLTSTAHDSSDPSVPRSEVLSSSHDPSGMGRRLTAPNLNREEARVLMKVRHSLLSTQQTVLSDRYKTKKYSSISTTSLHNPLSCGPSSVGRPRST